MSHYGDLNAVGIRQLNSDRQGIKRAPVAWFEFMGHFNRLLDQKIGNGDNHRASGKLSGNDITSLFEEADALMRARYQSFVVFEANVPATRVRPKGERREVVYVGASFNPDNRTYQLVSFLLTATRKKALFHLLTLPVRFSEHAIQRIMERTGNLESALAVAVETSLNWVQHIDTLNIIATQRTEGHAALPASDRSGLFLGEFINDDGRSFCYGIEHTQHGPGGVMPYVSATFGREFLIKTFVSSHQLRPDQTKTEQRMTDFLSENQCFSESVRFRKFWPQATACASALSDHSPEDNNRIVSLNLLSVADALETLNGFRRTRDTLVDPNPTDFTQWSRRLQEASQRMRDEITMRRYGT